VTSPHRSRKTCRRGRRCSRRSPSNPGRKRSPTIVLKDPNGDQFLVVTACLEYLQGRSAALADAAEPASHGDRDDGDGEDFDPDLDLGRGGRRLALRTGLRSERPLFRGSLMSHPVLAKAAQLIRLGDIVGAEAALGLAGRPRRGSCPGRGARRLPGQGSAGDHPRLRCFPGISSQPPGVARAVCPRHRP
jgi:hypothetical protein